MKKILCSFFALLIAVSIFPIAEIYASFEPSFEISAQSAYVVNLDTGIVVYEKNAHEKRSIASVTKLMTALLLLENVQDLENTKITAPGYIYDEIVTEMPQSSTADIRPYEEVTAKDLLYALLLPSANEAASIVADYIGNGNMQNFYSIMNARATQLGCKNTNFTSAHGYFGMERDNYSSAYDLYLIAKACYDTPLFMEAASTNQYWMSLSNKHPNVITPGGPEGSSYPIYTTNRMQQPNTGVFDPRIKGMKTGSTEQAGRNFVSTATDGEYTYLFVVLGSPYEPAEDGYSQAFHDTKALLDWCFKDFSVAPVMDTTRPIEQVSLAYSGETDVLKVYPQSNFMTLLPNGSDTTVVQKEFELPKVVSAPIKKGDVIGTVTLSLGDEKLGKVLLIANEDIERNNFLYYSDLVKRFFDSLFFKVLISVLAVMAIAYMVLFIIIVRKTKNVRRVNRSGIKFK